MADEAVRQAESGGSLAPQDSPFENLALQGGAAGAGDERSADPGKLDLVLDIPLKLSVELGRTELPIRDVMRLGRGSVVELDRGPGAPLDVRVNGVLIGRGEVVVVNEEKLGLRFVEVVSQLERAKRIR
ncbi:MAG: flagellar motor switch protein FliN [Stellaceae bacterium]